MSTGTGRSITSAALVAAFAFGLGLTGDSLGRAVDEVPESTPNGLPASMSTDWSVLGSSGRGRWLIVSAARQDPTCYHAEARLLEQTTDKIRIAVSYVIDDDVKENSSCISEDISLPPRRLRLKLNARLGGQSISGPRRKPARAVIRPERGELLGVESLQGLRARYATEILRATGFKKTLISVSGPMSAAVVSTKPTLPRTLKKPTAIALTAK